jgi:hypothetical protein
MLNRNMWLERTNTPRLIALVGLLILTIITTCCSGCASMEQFTDDHPETVVAVEIGAIAVGGVMMGKAIARSGHTQVRTTPAATGCLVTNYAECVR